MRVGLVFREIPTVFSRLVPLRRVGWSLSQTVEVDGRGAKRTGKLFDEAKYYKARLADALDENVFAELK